MGLKEATSATLEAMKNVAGIVLFVVIFTGMIFVLNGFTGIEGIDASQAMAAEAPAEPLTWTFRGVNYPSWNSTEYDSLASRDSLNQIRRTGANWVAISPTQYMSDAQATKIGPDPYGRTATDAAVAQAIDDAHARGLKVMFKPHIDVVDGSWRGEIQPRDITEWFSSYRAMINNYAVMAQEHGVELFVVATEFASLSGQSYEGEWLSVIADVRARYSGPLTYAASLNEYGAITFWGSLDYLALNFYFPLSDLAEPSTDDLVLGWTDYNGRYGPANWIGRVENWQARWGKQVIFTEIGYRSIFYVGVAPWDYLTVRDYNGDNQARAYDAAFKVLKDKPWLEGVFWWNWAVGYAGGAGDTGYVVHDKPAEAVLTSWYSSGAAAEPEVSLELGDVYWASYEHYRSRLLSVTYLIRNIGTEPMANTTVESGTASNGVGLATALPLSLGNIDPGSAVAAGLTYDVPSGVTSFRSSLSLAYSSSDGTVHTYPRR